MENRGLLTADDRALFQGEKDVENREKALRERRYNVRRRIEHIAEDLEILREAGEDELVEEFREETGQSEAFEAKLMAELADLREQLDDD